MAANNEQNTASRQAETIAETQEIPSLSELIAPGGSLTEKVEHEMNAHKSDRLLRDTPFSDTQSAREAIRIFSRPKTEAYEIEAIKSRLQISGIDMCQSITRALLDNFDNLIYDGQRVTFELTEYILAQSCDVARIIMPLSILVGNRDEDVRLRSTKLLCSIGSLAKPAEDIAMGCLRNSDASIRLSGAKILYAIGAGCSRSITRQLRSVAQRYATEREFCALLIGTVKRITDSTAVLLPAHTVEQERPSSESGRITAVLSKLLTGKTALIVEDNDVLLTTISEMLRENLHMKVLCADNGEHAIQTINQLASSAEPIDYMVVDLKMNGVNGLQVLKKLKEYPAFSDTTVVVISGVKDERISDVVLGTGAHLFLRKPFRLGQLIKAMVTAHAIRAKV